MRIIVFFILMMLPFPCRAVTGFPDLTAIDHLSPKGRVQDENYNPDVQVINELVMIGKPSIPYLIERLKSRAPLKRGVLDYWPHVEERHIALIILSDFFLTPDWTRSTAPEMCWDNLLQTQRYPDLAHWDILNDHFTADDWSLLKSKLKALWSKYNDKIYWDSSGRFFRIDGNKLRHCIPTN
jgi:hypothetical protein